MENIVVKACRIVGGQKVLAAAVGVTEGAVSHWVNGHREVPPMRCPAIERITGGAVRCEDLRPDVEWQVLRGESADQATA